MTREQEIVKVSIVGILANLLLAAAKAAAGLAANSLAIVLDAVNNLSDALSSVITLLGAKLAGKAPDRKHPLGYGRIEYLSALLVAGLVMYAGITAFVEAVKKIIEPEQAEYTALTLGILAAAIVVKLILGKYVKKAGEKVNSSALIASGADASFDAVLSASVLLTAVIYLTAGINLEAWVGVLLSVFIIKSAIEMVKDTLDDILGKRTDGELAKAIKRTVCEAEEVYGAYDLFLYNYGPGKDYGSIHIEVRDNLTVDEIDTMERRLAERVYQKHGIMLTGIGIYSHNTDNSEAGKMRKNVLQKVLAHQHALQVHGFYVNPVEKKMSFDVVISFACQREELLQEIRQEIGALYPDYELIVQADIDLTE